MKVRGLGSIAEDVKLNKVSSAGFGVMAAGRRLYWLSFPPPSLALLSLPEFSWRNIYSSRCQYSSVSAREPGIKSAGRKKEIFCYRSSLFYENSSSVLTSRAEVLRYWDAMECAILLRCAANLESLLG